MFGFKNDAVKQAESLFNEYQTVENAINGEVAARLSAEAELQVSIQQLQEAVAAETLCRLSGPEYKTGIRRCS